MIFHAAGSPAGTDFAAMVAEAIFAAQTRLEEARAYREAVKVRMPKYGRSPDTLKVLPGLSPIIGSTEQEAKSKEAELDELILPAVGEWMLSEQMQFGCDYDPTPDCRVMRSVHPARRLHRVISLIDRADREGLTVRACAYLVAKSRSHGTFVGTVEGLVDHMQLWLDTGGCDGFNIMPAWFPDELDVFVDQVVPELRRRDLFRTEYAGSMLRDHLGLPYPQRPVHRPVSVALAEPGAPE